MFKAAAVEPMLPACVLPVKKRIMTHLARKKQKRHYAINRLKMIKRKAKMKVMYKLRQQMETRKKLAGNLVQKTFPSGAQA